MFFFIKGIYTFRELLVLCFFAQLSNVCFWTIGYSLTYDVCEVDEFIYGQRREGSITGFASFFQKLGSAIGMWLSGILLTLIGYDGLVVQQTAETLKGILAMNTVIPSMFSIVSLIFLLLYPINKNNFQALLRALEQRKKGEAFSAEGFKELL